MARPNLQGKSDEQALASIQAEKAKKEEKRRLYESSYKNILWIDDRSDADAGTGNDPITWMEFWIKNPEELYRIEQEHLFRQAVEKIDNCQNYDLVIFDIDLEKGFMESTRQKDAEYLTEKFKECHVQFDYDTVSSEQGKKTAGIYLYLYLLSKGYPMDRMLIYTGNGADVMNDQIKKQLGYFDFDNSIFKRKQGQHTFSTESYFEGRHTYYKIRRMVFQACEYWKNQLKTLKSEEISFNRLYFYNRKKAQIPVSEFEELLNRAKLMMTVTLPPEPERLYYQMMQAISALHESKAVLGDLKDVKDLYKYHSCIRNFRNWSAHGKFKNKKLKVQEFALLFCIALRVYFTGSYEKPYFSDDLYEYEKNYGFVGRNVPQSQELQDSVRKLLTDTLEVSAEFESSLDKIIVRYSEQPYAEMEIRHLIFSLWNMDGLTERTRTSPLNTNVSSKNTEITATAERNAFYRIDTDKCKALCQNAQKNTAESLFMNCCYKWL